MKVLVSGSNGFIGSHLVENLLKRGHYVRCLVRKSSNLTYIKTLDVDFVYGELNNEISLYPAVRDTDCIFHLAGVVKARDQEGYFQGNFNTTQNLINAARTCGSDKQKFIFVSSLAAAGPASSNIPLLETNTPNPISSCVKYPSPSRIP